MDWQDRNLTVSYASSRDAIVPRIKLQGRWLANAGFHIGDRVSVVVQEGRLIIRREVANGINNSVAQKT